MKSKLAYAKKHRPEAPDKYAEQERIPDGRNSCSKTGHDATFMRMKEDHMENGQLKPACNVQASSSDQYAVDYSVHPDPTDTTTLIPHLTRIQEDPGLLPEVITADAGYGPEENYEHLEKEGITAYVKYGSFNKEQHPGEAEEAKRPFTQDKLYYNRERDCFTCPVGHLNEAHRDSGKAHIRRL